MSIIVLSGTIPYSGQLLRVCFETVKQLLRSCYSSIVQDHSSPYTCIDVLNCELSFSQCPGCRILNSKNDAECH